MEKWREYGKFFGYPQCCIDSFCKTRHISYEQRQVHNNNGFVPCHKCALKILNKEITIEELIKDRICKTPYPIYNDNPRSKE